MNNELLIQGERDKWAQLAHRSRTLFQYQWGADMRLESIQAKVENTVLPSGSWARGNGGHWA